MLSQMEIARAVFYGSEAMAQQLGNGVWVPGGHGLRAFHLQTGKIYTRFVEIVQTLAAGGFFYAPSEADLSNPETRPYIDKYVRGRAGVSAEERIALFKLAWDVTGDSFGQRMAQYVRFYSGDPIRLTAGFWAQYDKAPLFEIVERALGRRDGPADSDLRRRRGGAGAVPAGHARNGRDVRGDVVAAVDVAPTHDLSGLRPGQPRGRPVLRRLRRAPRGGVRRVPRGEPAGQSLLSRVRRRAGCGAGRAVRLPQRVHAKTSRGQDPHVRDRARRRAQAGHGALRRRLRVHVDVRAPGSRGSPPADEARVRPHAGRGPPLRRHGEPVPRRRHHGALRRADRPRRPCAARRARGPRHRAHARGVSPRARGARDHVSGPAGPEHRPRRRRQHRRRPAHGLHGRR